MENQTVNSPLPPPRPKNWLVESILATIFCCLPFGIAGIIFAAKVNSLYDDGNFEAAEKASKDAGTWTKVSFFVGIGIIVLSFILTFLGVFAGMSGLIRKV